MGAGSIARRSASPTGPVDLVAKIQRDVIARGVFSSVKDLEKKLMRYIRLACKNSEVEILRSHSQNLTRIKRYSSLIEAVG